MIRGTAGRPSIGRGGGRGEGEGKDAAGGRTPITVYRVGFHRGVESSVEAGE